MAASSYATDLLDLSLAEATTNFTAGGAASAANQENDYYMQGNYCVSASRGTQALSTGYSWLFFNSASGKTIPSPGGYFAWAYCWAPTALAAEASYGLGLVIGSSTTAYRHWTVRGSDSYVFGGWIPAVVDPAVTPDRTVGSPTTTRQYFGMEVNIAAAVSRGAPFGLDALRYGRGRLGVSGGDLANGYATFLGVASYDMNTARRWGLLRAIDGGYQMQGLLALGSDGAGTATAVDFRDSNILLTIANTKKVVAAFNGIEIKHASSRVDWTNVTVQALGTVSPGYFTVVDNADVNFSQCQFIGMGAFSLQAATDMLECIWRGCGQITAPGSNLSGSRFDTPTVAADASAVVWNVATDTDGKLNSTTFVKGAAAHHAITLGMSSPTTVALRNITFSGFNAANGQNDSTIYVARTTGTVTINAIGCVGNLSYKTAGATVVISQNPATLTITNLVPHSEVRIYQHGTITELAGTDDIGTGTTFGYQYTSGAGSYVDIVVMGPTPATPSEPAYLYFRYDNYQLSASDAPFAVQQQKDRQYYNPA